MFSDEYGLTLVSRTGENNLTYGSTTVKSYGTYSRFIISFDSYGNLNNINVMNNLTNSNEERSQSTDGSIFTAIHNSNSWNDSSGNQYPRFIFTKFVNGSINWLTTINTTDTVYYVDIYTIFTNIQRCSVMNMD